uniref:B30.2/SPRY domain-containing protein n=1 Tax=Labrus bergylta TaxID=56723 RepID=A0A3Q3FR46_9LABR
QDLLLSDILNPLAYELSCPICLQLYSDPVMTADSVVETLPRCPECRVEFQSVNTLQKNFKLCSIIEGYQATASLLSRQTETESECAEVFCDHCIDEQSLAVKTCLKCEVSLCSRHLQRHQEKESPYVIEHELREVVASTIPSKVPSKAPLITKRLQVGLKTQDFRSEMTHLVDSLHILLNPLDLTFNLVTAHPSLIVSNDLCTVKYSSTKQPYCEHPERFMTAPQVLCSQGFSSGEHVWVVEVGPNTQWSLGVCYKSILRRGDHSRLGHNSVSWRLQRKNGKLTVCQSSCNVALGEMTNYPLTIEVALDYEGGTVIFHSTKGHRDHLHTFRTVFREPVYPTFLHCNLHHCISLQKWIR